MILFSLSLSVSFFSGARATETPAVPGGPGVSIALCGRWPHSCGTICISSSFSLSRSFRAFSEWFFGVILPILTVPLTKWSFRGFFLCYFWVYVSVRFLGGFGSLRGGSGVSRLPFFG